MKAKTDLGDIGKVASKLSKKAKFKYKAYTGKELLKPKKKLMI